MVHRNCFFNRATQHFVTLFVDAVAYVVYAVFSPARLLARLIPVGNAIKRSMAVRLVREHNHFRSTFNVFHFIGLLCTTFSFFAAFATTISRLFFFFIFMISQKFIKFRVSITEIQHFRWLCVALALNFVKAITI